MKQVEQERQMAAAFTRREELANIVIHILGIVFGAAAIPFLLTMAGTDSPGHVISLCIYAFCFLLLFTSSTLFHSARNHKRRMLLKKLDRISIYFLIAGTYTAIIRFYLFDGTGIVLLSILWGLVLGGIFFELFFPDKFNLMSVLFYLLMGLIFVFVPNHFFAGMPAGVMTLVLTGIGLYIFGVVFYVWQKWRFHHAIWHFFVLSGGICHFAAMLETVA